MSCKKVPNGADTSGAYSSVIEVEFSKLVLICGQVSEDENDHTVGTTIEEQAICTLENCQKQLALAGCTFDDVFKVNVYMKNLDEWDRFNKVYSTFFKEPKPVRTTVQAGLLDTFMVEIEMWAAKK